MNTSGTNKRKINTYSLCITSVMTAVICILSPFSVQIGPVPISLANLAIYLSVYLLGWKKGTISCIAYILIGIAGLPVFSGFAGGLGKFMGPTGGYIAGFVPMAIIAGVIMNKYSSRLSHFLAMLAGIAVDYLIGTLWFCVVMDQSFAVALGLCVFPFIPGDILKVIIVLSLGMTLKSRLRSARHTGTE